MSYKGAKNIHTSAKAILFLIKNYTFKLYYKRKVANKNKSHIRMNQTQSLYNSVNYTVAIAFGAHFVFYTFTVNIFLCTYLPSKIK